MVKKYSEELISGINEILNSILNPLYMFPVVLDMNLPIDEFPYLSTLDEMISILFDKIFSFENNKHRIDELLKKHNINYDQIAKIVNKSNKLDMYIYLLDELESDILKMHTDIIKSVIQDVDVVQTYDNFKRLYNNIAFDRDAILDELENYNPFYDEEHIIKLTDTIVKLLENIFNNLVKSQKPINHNLDFMADTHDSDVDNTYDVHIISKKDKAINIDEDEEINIDYGVNKSTKVDRYKNIYRERLKLYTTILQKLVVILISVSYSNYSSYNIMMSDLIKTFRLIKPFQTHTTWFSKFKDAPSNMCRKCKFLADNVYWTLTNMENIVDMCFLMNNKRESSEYEQKISYMEITITHLVEMTCRMLSDITYSDSLMYFIEVQNNYFLLGHNKKKVDKKMEKVISNSVILKERIENSIGVSQDISMDTLLKLSYLVATYDTKAKGVVNINNGYTFNNISETNRLLEELGNSLKASHTQHGIPHMYKFFIESNKHMYNKLLDGNYTRSMIDGIMCVKFLSFILDDKNMYELVNRIEERII